MKYKRSIILLSIIFSLCSCFFAYAYWTDKLKLKLDLRINYSVPIVINEEETLEETEENTEVSESKQSESKQSDSKPSESKQSDSKPSETKHSESKQGEGKHSATKAATEEVGENTEAE